MADAGNLRLASHLAETAALAAPDNARVHEARAHVFHERARQEQSLMARGIFNTAAAESAAAAAAGGSKG